MSTPPASPQGRAEDHGDHAPSSAATEFRPDRRFWLVYACLLTVMFLTALYHTVVATALPTIVGDLGGVEHMSWTVTGYTIAQTIAMPAAGKLGDLVGRKRVYLVGIVLFIGGSVLCALVPSMVTFVLTRFVQGLGGGALMVSSQAITGDLIPPRVRGTYMAPVGAMFGMAAILGPFLGGWLTDSFGWRSIFWFFMPFGVFAWVAVALALHLPRRPRSFSVDWAGLALCSTGATGVVLLASWGGTLLAWTSPVLLAITAVTLVAWVLLVPVERRASDPVLPLTVLTNHTFVISTLVSVLMAGCLFGIHGYLPTYVQMVHGVSATASGLLLVPGSAGMFIGAMTSGRLVTRTGRYRIYPVLGSLIAAVGMAALALVPPTADPRWLGVAMFVLQLGIGMFLQLGVLIIQNALPASILGTATATTNFFREIGVSLGNSIVGVLFSTRLSASLLQIGLSRDQASSITPEVVRTADEATAAAVRTSYAEALSPVLLGLVPVLVVAAGIALLFRPLPLSTRTGLEQINDELAGKEP